MKSLGGTSNPASDRQDDFFFHFNASFRFDVRLAEVDVIGSMAYARGLARCRIFNETELTTVLVGLDNILQKLRQDPAWLKSQLALGYEDVHAWVEIELTKSVGDLGKRLHTGRSRNDQVATDLRLYLRDAIDRTQQAIASLQDALLKKAEAHPQVVMPGYTHMQKAQPILFAHYLLSYYEMLKRDIQRLKDCRKRVNIMPLGSGALAGNSLSIDREALARDLGFDGITANSLDATSDRDFAMEYLSVASISMMHLSRLAEDLILYCSDEFRFVRMGDQVSTGSSLMPQKKNPDALELIRGKTGRTYGNLMTLLTVMKGLPSCYNKDMQEDKEALFDSIDTWGLSLKVMKLVIDTLTLHPEAMLREAHKGYMNATDLADYYVGKGLPFRESHQVVSAIVKHAMEKGLSLNELPLDDYCRFYEGTDDDVYRAVSLESVLSKKASLGGTAPERVKEALRVARQDIRN
ncbi:MAG: argininosuccinate lyase [Chitinophagaceae bacterium]|nr:argininosuccinate lyase [Oligoflexus sp.]